MKHSEYTFHVSNHCHLKDHNHILHIHLLYPKLLIKNITMIDIEHKSHSECNSVLRTEDYLPGRYFVNWSDESLLLSPEHQIISK